MATAKIIIKGENQLKSPLNQAKQDLTGFEQTASSIGKTLQNAFSVTAIIAGIAKLTQALKECVNEYTEAEKVSLRLTAVWNNVGKVTGKTAKEIDDYADAIEKSTYFTKEAVQESALLLAATEKLTGDGFQRALDVSADLAAALGEDMTSAASLLAKTLEDPASALNRLKSIGVTFTEEEKNQIKALSDANEMYEAQSIILDKIESKYKDVAKAINNTPAGKLENIKNLLSDIRKSIGQSLLNSISPALDSLYEDLKKLFDLVNPYLDKGTFSISKDLERMLSNYGSYWARAMHNGEDFLKEGTTSYNVAQSLLKEIYEQIKKEGLTTDNLNELLGQYKTNLDSKEGSWSKSEYLWGSKDSYSAAYAQFIGLYSILEDAKYSGKSSSFASPVDSIETSANEIEETVQIIEEAISDFEAFFKSYGSSSQSYVKETYQAIIDQAESFMKILEMGTYLDEDGSIPAVSQLGLPEGTTISDLSTYYKQLGEVVATYTDKIAKLEEVKEEVKAAAEEKNPFNEALSKYGSLSKAFQIDEIKNAINELSYLRITADDVTGHYLDEIVGSLFDQLDELEKVDENTKDTRTFLEKFGDNLGSYVGSLFGATDEQGKAAGAAIVSSFTSQMGEAGEVVSRLATNMATMGPLLGAIVTALHYVIGGLMETLRDVFNDFIKWGIEPLKELGRMIGQILLPIFKEIMPSVIAIGKVLIQLFQSLANVLSPIVSIIMRVIGPILSVLADVLVTIVGTISWACDWLAYAITWVLNKISFGWIEQSDKPTDLNSYLNNMYADPSQAYSPTSSSNTAVSNASYSGGTVVHLNVYNYGNVVGDNGITEFALIIRDKLVEANYLGR